MFAVFLDFAYLAYSKIARPCDVARVARAARVIASSYPARGEENMSTPTKPSIVFSHGIWADGSCFSKLMPTLQAEGHDVIAAQYGLDTLKADVDASMAAIERVAPGPVVLVGHSYGGTVITKAGVHPTGGCSGLHLRAGSGRDRDLRQRPGQVSHHRRLPEHRRPERPYLAEAGHRRPVLRRGSVRRRASPRLRHRPPPAAELFTQQVQGVAWRTKPSWYIVGAEDRAVHPDLERFCAKRMGATTTELQSSHVPMLSQPGAVLDVIHAAAKSI